jgi:tetratricopeptide (TPR) repeat protein
VLDGLTYHPEADLARADALIVGALAAAPRSVLARFAKGQVLRAQHQATEALAEYETVLALDRNHLNALAATSWCRVYLGSFTAAISALEQVIRLSPRDPQIGVWFARIGLVHLLQSRIDEAVKWLERARNANPELPYVRCHLASAYALNHDIESASTQLAEAQKLRGGDSYASIARIRTTGFFGVPLVAALYEATFLRGYVEPECRMNESHRMPVASSRVTASAVEDWRRLESFSLGWSIRSSHMREG